MHEFGDARRTIDPLRTSEKIANELNLESYEKALRGLGEGLRASLGDDQGSSRRRQDCLGLVDEYSLEEDRIRVKELHEA